MDRFHRTADSVSDPARTARPVFPTDGAILPSVPKALFVGSAGNVHLRCIDDTDPVLFRNLPAGAILPVRVVEILASGTTASDLVVLG